jgi:hypothetical protein
MDYAGAIRETIDLDVSPYCLIPGEKRYYIALKERIIITDRNGKRESEWPLLGDNSWITAMLWMMSICLLRCRPADCLML